MAERGGFEPPIEFCPIHAFQACAFNRSAISPHRRITKYHENEEDINLLSAIILRTCHIKLETFAVTMVGFYPSLEGWSSGLRRRS